MAAILGSLSCLIFLKFFFWGSFLVGHSVCKKGGAGVGQKRIFMFETKTECQKRYVIFIFNILFFK